MTEDPALDNLLNSLESVTDGALFNISASLIVKGLKFILVVLLAQGLGAKLYGVFTLGEKIMRSLIPFGRLGTALTTIRYIAANRDEPDLQDEIIGLSYVTTFVFSSCIALLVFVFAAQINSYTLNHQLFPITMRTVAVALPFLSMVGITASGFKAIEQPAFQAGLNIAKPLIQLLLIGTALAIGYSLIGVTAAFTISCLLAFVFSIVLLVKFSNIRPKWGLDRDSKIDFFSYSIPLTISKAGNVLTRRLDIFMVGIFLSASDVAVYNVALVLGSLVAIPLAGFNQIFPPVASRMYSNNNITILQTVYSLVTRWAITASLLVSVPLLAYPAEILQIFGNEFQEGIAVVGIIVIGQIINVSVGPSNDILIMTDHQYIVLLNNWTMGLLNIVLNYVLILEFGIIGAAVATAGVLGIINIARVVEVYYFEGLMPYSLKVIKPLVAFVLALVVMRTVSTRLSGIPLIFAGSVIGTIVFFGALYVFGIETRDKQFIRHYKDTFLERLY
jgi:O-antigen/teichoic acid export membrane protein